MENNDTARQRAEMPPGTNHVLNARTLDTAHRRLAELLRPGMSVLDVGCGTGAITRGIAEAVAPNGRAVGMDVNPDLIAEARRLHADVPGLEFAVGDILVPTQPGGFDIVTAARVLQWLADPALALRNMVAATRPGGLVLVLDYNHEKIIWEPEPPASMRRFYEAFLRWRSDAGMDNAIADHLIEIFVAEGLKVGVTQQHEHTQRGDVDFATRIGIWAQVAEARGLQVVRDGYLTEQERETAVSDYREWVQNSAEIQSLYLLAVQGRVAK
jgi:ubiquinone/menaquinone biosynthesis C-methylase UbiE